jgi:hypothetical protein
MISHEHLSNHLPAELVPLVTGQDIFLLLSEVFTVRPGPGMPLVAMEDCYVRRPILYNDK